MDLSIIRAQLVGDETPFRLAMDILKKDMHNIRFPALNKTLHVFSDTRSIQLKDIQNDG